MKKRPSLKEQKNSIEVWNRHVSVGQYVHVRRDSGEVEQRKTTSEAQLLGGHTAVVWLDGIAGAYALDRCTPIYA